MASFTKAILKVGEYQSPDGAVKVTPERLRHWARQFRKMRGKRLGIPVGWDHSDKPEETVPVAFSRGAGPRTSRNSAGWLSRFEVAEDGSHATIELDVRDKQAAGKVASNVVEVSPIIYPEWTDGRGRNWRDVITHIDLVNHPVDDSQTDFEPVESVALSCCLRMSADVGGPTIYRLGAGNMKPSKHPKKYRMEDDDFDDDEELEYEGDDETEEAPSEEMPAAPEMGGDDDDEEEEYTEEAPAMEEEEPGEPEAPAASRSFATQILEDLESVGIAVPNVNPDANPQEFLGQLSASLRQKSLDEQLQEADKAKQMSEEIIKKEAERGAMPGKPLEEKTPEFAALSLQAKTLQHYAETENRKKLMGRLNRALQAGKCTPHQKEQIAKEIGVVRLSLDGAGKPLVSDAEKKIALIESYPEGAAFDLQERLRMSREVPPPSFAGDISDEEAERLADQVYGKKTKAS